MGQAEAEPIENDTIATTSIPSGRHWIWAPRIDPNCGEYGLFVNQNNTVRINQGDSRTVITGMRIILNNQFAPMPICGHGYSSAQFIGQGSTEFSLQIAGLGDERISDLQVMHETLEKNAREFRRFRGAARVRFSNNEFLRLAGIYDGLITSIDTETDSNGTNLYRCQISFTSDGHHTEGFSQELYVENDTVIQVLEGLLERVGTTLVSPSLTAQIESGQINPEDILRERTSTPTSDVALPNVSEAVWNWYRGVLQRQARELGYERSGNITSVDGLLEASQIELERAVNRFEDWWTGTLEGINRDGIRGALAGFDRLEERGNSGAYLRFPIQTPVPINQDDSAFYTVNQSSDHVWINRYVEQIVDILNEWQVNLPGQPFFRGPTRGKYYDFRNRISTEPAEGIISNWPPLLGNESSKLCEMMHGRRRWWAGIRTSSVTGRNSIEMNLLEFENQLMSIAQQVLAEAQGEADFNEVFPNVQEQLLNSRRLTAHPTYPDLDLPPHPVSHLSIDTEPDFYFFNDSEEGFLNEVGPELVNEIDVRLQNCEVSYAKLSGGQEWAETYLGRSRIAVDDFDERRNPSLNSGDPFNSGGCIDGTNGLRFDPTTTNGQASWGPEGGVRPIGGRSTIANSVVDSLIAQSPTIRSSFSQSDSAVQLARRRASMIRNTSFSLPTGTPHDGINIGPIDTAIGVDDRSHSFERNALRTIVQQSIAQAPEETLTMRRAFPTFKIYFIEDDTGAMRENLLPSGGVAGIRPIMFFDDLYSYNSVKSIRLIRSRKNPADLLILQLTNVQGLLERRRWTGPSERQRELYLPGFEETEFENPLKKLIMKEGLKVQARLGYSNNPNKMGIKFIGEVVEVSYNAEIGDEVTLICQSFGAELTLEKKGVTEGSRPYFIDTPDLVHSIMCSPELAHFGRFELNPQFNPGEARSVATSRRDSSTGGEDSTGRIFRNPTEVIQELKERLLVINRSKWILANNAADDNIFAPGIRDHLTSWQRITDDIGSQLMWEADVLNTVAETMRSGVALNVLTLGRSYIAGHIQGWIASGLRSIGEWLNDGGIFISGQTIWELLKECELRHPGWIAQPRPYGTRQTLFFGVPSHRYWADEISREEMLILQRLRSANDEAWRSSASGTLATGLRSIAGQGVINSASGTQNIMGLLTSLGASAQWIYLRTCHEIETNQWLADGGQYIGRTLGRFRPFRRYHLLTSDHHILMNNIRASQYGTFNAVSLQYANGNIYTLKADDSIPDELTRVESFHYPNCGSEVLARRYCIGLLNRHLKDVYKGEIVVTGMDVDPYDICYMNDDRTGMYGAFEIEQVVDTFTSETGWITEITPDLITGGNEYSTMSTIQARNAVLGQISQRYFGHKLSNSQATAAGMALALIGGYYIVRWTQERQPIWIAPLILGERPFFAGLDGFRQDGVFASIRGELSAEFDAVREGWRQFHLDGYANNLTINLSRSLAGQ